MIRFGQIIHLKPASADEYVKQHSAVWEPVLETISACNIKNYSIFKKDNVLFFRILNIQEMTLKATWEKWQPMKKHSTGGIW